LSYPNKKKGKERRKKKKKTKGGKEKNSWKRIIFCDTSYPQTTFQG
jgi:hypothetical protein